MPSHFLAPGTLIEDPTTGCRGCASGPGGNKNIFGNKYGQYLAAIQIAREEKRERLAAQEAEEEERGRADEGDDEDESEGEEDVGPVGHADGRSMSKGNDSLWATEQEEAEVDVSYLLGQESKAGDAANEAAAALKKSGSSGGDNHPHKKQRH